MTMQLAGYCDPLSVRAGGEVSFMLHSEAEGEVEIDLVRIVHGDRESGPGLVLEPVPVGPNRRLLVRPQTIAAGSYGLAGEAAGSSRRRRYGFGCALYLTRGGRRQGVMGVLDAENGAGLFIDEKGRLNASFASEGKIIELALAAPLPLDVWCFVGLCIDAEEHRVELFARPIGNGSPFTGDRKSISVAGLGEGAITPVVFGGRLGCGDAGVADRLDGRLDSPRFLAGPIRPDDLVAAILAQDPTHVHGAEVIGFWDFSIGQDTRVIVDRGPLGLCGRLHNLPSRACVGFRWSGKTHDWRRAPVEYGAIHFHADATYDLEWHETLKWTVPSDLRSGAYALRLRRGNEIAYVTFFVSPAADTVSSVVFLASTATYLAYANETVHLRLMELLYGEPPEPAPEYELLLRHPEFGGSLYESHSDGRGVRYSSWLRPLVNVRPDTRMWSFNADTAILHWLERETPAYDVLTDHDLQARGLDALAGAQVVVTGTHPEYYSGEMLDALDAFLARGGRLMYMGGNGFYWRISYSGAWPAAIEVRRAEDGTRAWIEEPAEYHHAFDGELGGLWRRQRRSPNRLVGVGFAAQGFSRSNPYHVAEGARDPRASFIFDGVESELIGDFGARGGGAAGEEIDRFDLELGSPAHALVLASSRDHAPDMLRVKEEMNASAPYGADPKVRADLVFFETRAGGAVFSTGSIAWAGALSEANYENDVARISTNVLRRFADPAPFVFPKVDVAR